MARASSPPVQRRTGMIAVGAVSAVLGGLLAGPGLAAAGDLARPLSRAARRRRAPRSQAEKNVIFMVGDGRAPGGATGRPAGRSPVSNR